MMKHGEFAGGTGIGEIHPARLRNLFETAILGRVIVLFDRTQSTNSAAAAAADAGAPEGTLVLADVQIAGRGRAGRSWRSRSGRSLVFSLILKPGRIGSGGLTMLLALSTARALERFQNDIRIKWPNDIYCNGCKLAGILAESRGGVVVMGLGININEEIGDLDTEIRTSATSLRSLTGRLTDRGAVLAAIVGEFEADYLRWKQQGPARWRDEVERRLLYINEDIRLDTGSAIVKGKLSGVTEEGHLRIQTGEGEEVFASGDVSAGER